MKERKEKRIAGGHFALGARLKKAAAVLLLILLAQSQTAWAQSGGENRVELIFSGSGPMEVTVYDGPMGKGEAKEAEDGRVVLESAKSGRIYSYKAASCGRTSEMSSFVLTDKELRDGRKVIRTELSPLSGGGYEAKRVKNWSEEVEEKRFSEGDLQNVDFSILDTPAFKSSKRDNQFTSVEEGISYLKKLDGKSKSARLFFLDEQENWPVMLFTRTDISSADTLEEALSRIKKDGKVKVLYQAQIHGNEPAAGEGALTVAASLAAEEESLLANTDVVIVPYANRYGAEKFLRCGNRAGQDLNRDGLTLQDDATRRLHWLYCRLMPEVFLDGHEFSPFLRFLQQSAGMYLLRGLDDIQLTCVNSLNREDGLYEVETAMLEETGASLDDKGFRTFIYPPSANAATSCGYSRLFNAYTFLIESGGIDLGRAHFARRVLSHHEAVISLLSQVSRDSASIRQTVLDARENLKQKGKTYSSSDKFVLKHGTDKTNGVSLPRPLFDFRGELSGEPARRETVYNLGRAVRSRTRPTAYIIGKNAKNREAMAELLRANGAEVKRLTANTRITVRQYGGSTKKAVLSKKKTLTFRKGAYVCFMDQEAANVVSAMLEPDFGDNGGLAASFAQQGLMKKLGGGSYPLYRCEFSHPREKVTAVK